MDDAAKESRVLNKLSEEPDASIFWVQVRMEAAAFSETLVEHVWNVMAHAQKPDLVFCISGSNGNNAGYTMFWGRVQEYWLPTPLACFPFTSPTVRHRVPSRFNWALHIYCNSMFDLHEFDYSCLQLVVSTDPSQGIYRGIRSRFALSVLYIHWGSSTNNFWLLVVHLAFTTANSVHLTTTDYLLSLSDTDTNSEHLPIADIANRESIHMWEGNSTV